MDGWRERERWVVVGHRQWVTRVSIGPPAAATSQSHTIIHCSTQMRWTQTSLHLPATTSVTHVTVRYCSHSSPHTHHGTTPLPTPNFYRSFPISQPSPDSQTSLTKGCKLPILECQFQPTPSQVHKQSTHPPHNAHSLFLISPLSQPWASKRYSPILTRYILKIFVQNNCLKFRLITAGRWLSSNTVLLLVKAISNIWILHSC